ncbi:MAG: ABC transporter substrate-binding protein [Eubacteriales bacterium]
MSKKRIIKFFSLALVLLLAVTALAGCGGGNDKKTETETQTQTQPVNLTVWWWGEQEAPGAQKWMDETVALYQKEHPNIKIKTVLQSTDQLVPAFKAAAAAKQGPDIQYFWGGVWTLEDAWAGSLVPLNDLIPAEEMKHYINNNERTFDGKQWGIGWYLSGNAIAYNKDLFNKAGLDPANPPKTWDEFIAACAKLKKAGITPVAAGVKDGWLGGWLWQLLNTQTLDSVDYIKKAAVGESKFTDEKYAQWWGKLKELKDKGYFNNDVASLDYQQGQDMWLQGKAAMVFGNDTFFPGWIKQMGVDKVGIMQVPVYGTGKMADTITVTAQGWGVTSWSKQQKEAANFLVFMHTPDRIKAWYDNTGVLPADDRFDASAVKLPQMKQMNEWYLTKPSLNMENFIPSMLEERGIFPGVQLLLSGEKNAKDAAALTEKAIKEWRSSNPAAVEKFKNWIGK